MAKELQAQTNQTTGTVYGRLKNTVAQSWYTVTPAFETYNAAHITNYALAGTQQGASGYWTADMPAAVTVGKYTFCFYLQGGGSPAESDVAISQVGTIDYTGTVESAAVAYLPQAQAGAASGVLIAGANADTTFADLDITGTLHVHTNLDVDGVVVLNDVLLLGNWHTTGTTTLTGTVTATDAGNNIQGVDIEPVFATIMTDGGYSFMQWLEIVGAATAGKSSGGPNAQVFKGMGSNVTRLTTVTDDTGNRTSIIIAA